MGARGLDVDDIKVVVNYDYPNNSEDYVHRIGRTGRKDNSGTAYTFFTPQDEPKAEDLVAVLNEAGQVVGPQLQEMVDLRRFMASMGQDGGSMDPRRYGKAGKKW